LKVNPNYTGINVADQEIDPNSVLNYFRKMIRLRKQDLTLVYGKYELLDKDNPDVYSYTRTLNNETIVVMLNFKDKPATAMTGIDLNKAEILACNYPNNSTSTQLRPYEARVCKLPVE